MTTSKLSPSEHRVKISYNLMVPMRDGVHLATDVYAPIGAGPVPTILERTPFGRSNEIHVRNALNFASRGYAYVLQEVRGKYDSEGEWYPLVHEAEDGYDTQEWVASQVWSNGKIGTFGGFYPAACQWLAAELRNPHLLAMAPALSCSNFFRNWVYQGGAFQLEFNLLYFGIRMPTRVNQDHFLWIPEPNDLGSLFRHLPLNSVSEATGRSSQAYQDWLEHSTYDDYWRDLRSPDEHYGQVEAPALGLGGWYDFFHRGTLENFWV